MKKYLFIFFIFVNLFVYGFQIDDITFDAQVGGNGYREYKIYNDSLKKQIYKVKIKGVGNIDITKDMTVYPQILAVEPQSYATLKIYGGDKTDAPKGEYSFFLSFNPVVVPKVVKDADSDKITGISTVGIIPEIEMNAYVGNVDWAKSLDINNITEYKDKDGKLHIKFDVVNKGYTTVTVAVRVANKENNKSTSSYLGRLKPGKRMKKEIEVPMFDNLEEIESMQLYNTSLGIVYIDKNLKNNKIIGGKKL